MRFRLSVLSFLVYAPLGATWPLFPRHLDGLDFSPIQIALVCATQALGAIIGPLLAGQAADRWLAPERCLALCGFASGSIFLVLPSCTTPASVFPATLGFWLLMAPAMTLGTSISFAHLTAPEREFGQIRLWGTVGWVLQGWVVGYALAQPEWLGQLLAWLRPELPRPVLADSFRLAAGLAFLLGLYALTIPPTHPRRDQGHPFAPLLAVQLFRRPAFSVYFLCNFLLCLTYPFGTQNTPLLLKHLGVADRWAGPALTIAQSTEIITLGLLPWLLSRWGVRKVLLVGAGAWALSLSVQSVGTPAGLVIACLSLNGVFITCFIVAGQVCVNQEAGPNIRASAQALIAFSNGLGQLLGYGLSGVVRQATGGAFGPTFAVATLLAWVSVGVLSAGFRPSLPGSVRKEPDAGEK